MEHAYFEVKCVNEATLIKGSRCPDVSTGPCWLLRNMMLFIKNRNTTRCRLQKICWVVCTMKKGGAMKENQ